MGSLDAPCLAVFGVFVAWGEGGGGGRCLGAAALAVRAACSVVLRVGPGFGVLWGLASSLPGGGGGCRLLASGGTALRPLSPRPS